MEPKRLSQATLIDNIDENVCSVSSPTWTATLCFKGNLCHKSLTVPLLEYVLQDYDLFELTKRTWKGCLFRFDPSIYPVVPGGFAQNESSYKLLLNDLMRTSHQHHHCTLTSNGWRGGKETRQIACTQLRRSRVTTLPQSNGELQDSSHSGDNPNSRGATGKSMTKQARTPCLMRNNTTCKANFVVGIDNHSLYMICGNGNNVHTGHPPLSSDEMTMRKKLIPVEANHQQESVAIPNVGPPQIQTCDSDEDINFPAPDLGNSNEMLDDGAPGMNAFAKFNPMFQELISLMDGIDKEMENEVESAFQRMIMRLQQFHAAKMSQPKNSVTTIPINQRSKSKHKKQKHHH